MSSLLVATEADTQSNPCEGREGVWGRTGILLLIINLSTR